MWAIFVALEFGQDFDNFTRARLCRAALRHLGLWDDADERPFISGMRWGPGPLSVLFYRLAFDPVRLRKRADELLGLIRRERGRAA
jgi:hypothetical protein